MQNVRSLVMSSAVCAFFLVWSLHRIGAEAELPPPQVVDIITLNTNYTLTWDWTSKSADSHSVTFTTQYLAKYKLKHKKKSQNWSKACEETSKRSCDLTALNLHYLGIYIVRVRANLKRDHSNWVQKEFCPDKDANVGPPSRVDLAPAGLYLDIVISDPLTSTNTSMKEYLPMLYYNILYWEPLANTQALMINTTVNMVTLSNLKAWTWYCVRVQSRCDFYNKSSSFTSQCCMKTEGDTPWWQVFLYFLGSLLLGFLVVLLLFCSAFWSYKNFKDTFYPQNQLPAHFNEHLFDSPGSDIPHLLSSDPESEPLCEHVIVCNPSTENLPEHLSSLHSRQDSGSSRDSGVYSNDSSSNPQLVIRAQDCLKDPSEPQQLKMQEIKCLSLIIDKGIIDVCV